MTFLLCNTHQRCGDTNTSETAHFLPLSLIHSFGATGACRKNQCRREKGFATGYNKCLLKLKCAQSKCFNTLKKPERRSYTRGRASRRERKHRQDGWKKKNSSGYNALDTIWESWKRSKVFKRYGLHVALQCAGVWCEPCGASSKERHNVMIEKQLQPWSHSILTRFKTRRSSQRPQNGRINHFTDAQKGDVHEASSNA